MEQFGLLRGNICGVQRNNDVESATEQQDGTQIGARLRAARTASGLTLEQLAQATNLSKGFLSRLENDATSLRLPTLIAICNALAVPVGSLFEVAEQSIIRSHEALPLVPVAGSEVVEWLLTPSAESNVQLLRASYPPGGGTGDELHTLDAEVEVAHVQSGRLVVSFSTGDVELAAGDTLTFRAREPHGWHNPDENTTADVLWVIAPAPWGLRRRQEALATPQA